MEDIKNVETIEELLSEKQYTKLRQMLSEVMEADIAAMMGS